MRSGTWKVWLGILSVACAAIAAPGTTAAGTIEDAIQRAAADLVADQESLGSWGEFGFTGEGVAGLAHAYVLNGVAGYKTAAENGGDYCLYDEGGYNAGTHQYDYGLYASGAYALTRLSAISANPASNSWRTAVGDFYEQVRLGAGTQTYINGYLNNNNAEDSSAVYDIARHTVAAFYVDATDKALWHSGLITALADIEGGDASPVMALGAAIWGLALTGVLDSTVISTNSSSYFYNKTLEELPDMLASHQAADGSFYTKFNHTLGSGFTETTAMGALGLISAYANDPTNFNYGDEIYDARTVLAGGVGAGGQVYWKIGDSGYAQYYFLAGETLEALPEPASLGLLAVGGAMMLVRRRRV